MARALQQPRGCQVKEQLEDKPHSLICNRTITLATAQRAIATNWWTASLTGVGATSFTYKAPVVSQPAPAPVQP